MFLYHRSYDSLILALPLFYCVDWARMMQPSDRRFLYKAVATGLVLVLNFPRGGVLIRLSNWTQTSGLVGRLVQILVLPYCTWILLASLFLLWYLGRESRGVQFENRREACSHDAVRLESRLAVGLRDILG